MQVKNLKITNKYLAFNNKHENIYIHFDKGHSVITAFKRKPEKRELGDCSDDGFVKILTKPYENNWKYAHLV